MKATKAKREPQEGIQYCHKDNSTMLEVIRYMPEKEQVIYRRD